MTHDELAEIGSRLYGSHGWQRRLAEALGVNERTVRGWLAGRSAIRPEIAAEIRALKATPRRIGALGATVFRVPRPDQLPDLCARIVRLWGEIRLADEALALELARRLPEAQIRRG